MSIQRKAVALLSGGLDSSTCLAWARLNDERIPAACEADIGAMACHVLVQYLFDRPGFQQDPVAETAREAIIGAHCSCATRLGGFDQPPGDLLVGKSFGQKAKDGSLSYDELTGGTFTISNGGVFGSMLSTPILNPPQSAILGMHNIVERPVVVNGEIVIRPMMYLALSYDHRIIDGREAVQFLVSIKQSMEDPARMLLGV